MGCNFDSGSRSSLEMNFQVVLLIICKCFLLTNVDSMSTWSGGWSGVTLNGSELVRIFLFSKKLMV